MGAHVKASEEEEVQLARSSQLALAPSLSNAIPGVGIQV